MTAGLSYMNRTSLPSRLAAQIPVLHPKSHYVRSIFELSSWVLWVYLVIFLIVAGLVGYAGWRFRATAGEDDPKQVFGSTKWEMI